MRKLSALAVAALAVLIGTTGAAADGTETLGPPSVTIASGTGIVAAGIGMTAFPNMPAPMSVTVPAGATVKQVLLYWEGHFSSPFASAGDNSITVNGNAVTGTLIGGPTAFFSQQQWNTTQTEMFATYRADITSLGLVSAGANTLTVNNMLFESNFGSAGGAFNAGNDGAGVLVIYDTGGTPASISVRDGSDLAYFAFAPSLDTTVPQTFTFAASASPRSANLATLAGSVRGTDVNALRGNILRVTFDVGGTLDIVNPWQSNQGLTFDAVNSAVTIPAGATSMTVQALSQGGTLPASFAWIAASLSIEQLQPPPPPPPPPAAQGCTPGYWKNHDGSKKQGNAWTPTGYSPTQLLSSVFSPAGLGTLGSSTLRQALDFSGGPTLLAKKQLLVHHAVAALLNAAHAGVSYPMTTAQIIAAVNAALASNDATTIENLKNQLDTQNNAGCPLGNA